MNPLVAITSVSAGYVAQQCAKSLIVVIVLFVGFRVAGKRELSQLNVYDLAMLMALSNAVQNAMTAGRGNLAVGLATSSTIVVAAWALTRVLARRPRLERRVMGSPCLLVFDGKVLTDRMRREEVTQDQLAEACRSRGLDDPRRAKMVVLEVDGSISVIQATATGKGSQPRVRKRRGRRSATDR
jgi:uncharacterized membrane protein YcaP (DUF421 family)